VTLLGLRRAAVMKFSKTVVFSFSGILFLCLHANAAAQSRGWPNERSQPESTSTVEKESDFFPLAVGNEWIYSNGSSSFKVQVRSEAEEANGEKYFQVAGYFQNDASEFHKIRKGLYGKILEYNPNGADYEWYRFGNLSSIWKFSSGKEITCITSSLLTTRHINDAVDAPAGSFERTNHFIFQSPCADMGILTEDFADGVGLVQRVVESFIGPITYKLVYAHVASHELPASAYGIQVSMSQPVYYNNLMPPVVNPWPTANILFSVRNTTGIPVEFVFPTFQRFDFIVRDAQGIEVLRWSDGLMFAQTSSRETLDEDAWRFPASLTLKSRKNEALPAGIYTLTSYLTGQLAGTSMQSMTAAVAFEIRNSQ
jgi:hypothetical protein